MNYTILDFLQLIGSLGVFLFGMKMMSEALQKVAGNKMRTILAAMTSNRVKGVITGLLITTIIQSSSATTVMVVSFVNAGLLDLIGSNLHPRVQDQYGQSFSSPNRVEPTAAFLGKTDAQELGGIDYRFRTSIYRSELPAGKYAEYS